MFCVSRFDDLSVEARRAARRDGNLVRKLDAAADIKVLGRRRYRNGAADIHIDTYADAQVEHGHGQRQVRLHQRVPFQELPEPVAQDLDRFVAVQVVIGEGSGEALR